MSLSAHVVLGARGDCPRNLMADGPQSTSHNTLLRRRPSYHFEPNLRADKMFFDAKATSKRSSRNGLRRHGRAPTRARADVRFLFQAPEAAALPRRTLGSYPRNPDLGIMRERAA